MMFLTAQQKEHGGNAAKGMNGNQRFQTVLMVMDVLIVPDSGR